MVRLNFFKKQEEKKERETSEELEKEEATSKNSKKSIDQKKELTERFLALIKRPILTEKATHQRELNKYFFEVSKDANKSEIKKLIESYYNVKVKKINIIKGKKRKKRWMRIIGREPKYKKAIVTLEEGYKIDIEI